MKKIASLTMVVVLLLCMFTFNVSAQENVSVYIDGSKIEFDVQPQIINGRTLVPMRKIFEELGAVVDWDNSTQTATGTKEETVVKFTINDYTMYKNETANTLDVPPQLTNGRTLIPLRAVSEAFNCQVGWDGNTNTISIINDLENHTMLYALNDRSKSFPTDSISEQLTVGWYTEPVVTMYSSDGRTQVVKKTDVEANKKVGWYETKDESMAVNKYEQGLSLMNNGEYEAAKNIFVELGDYKDSQNRLKNCNHMILYNHILKYGKNSKSSFYITNSDNSMALEAKSNNTKISFYHSFYQNHGQWETRLDIILDSDRMKIEYIKENSLGHTSSGSGYFYPALYDGILNTVSGPAGENFKTKTKCEYSIITNDTHEIVYLDDYEHSPYIEMNYYNDFPDMNDNSEISNRLAELDILSYYVNFKQFILLNFSKILKQLNCGITINDFDIVIN